MMMEDNETNISQGVIHIRKRGLYSWTPPAAKVKNQAWHHDFVGNGKKMPVLIVRDMYNWALLDRRNWVMLVDGTVVSVLPTS